jgi:glycosyltransferase involved in cell wall biosynthesis
MNYHAAYGPSSGAAGRPIRVGMLVGSLIASKGGVSEAVRSLSRALNQCPGVSVEIFTLASGDAEIRGPGEVPIHCVRTFGPASFGYAPRLLEEVRESDVDILHVHGLWMYLSVAARRWAKVTGRPYVVSPHGMLDPWALRNSGAKKKIARLLYENAHLRKAACLHALCGAEREAIRRTGLDAPIAVLPNGVDLPASAASPAAWRERMGKDAKVLLFLGRVTPKKQVLELVVAFALAHRPGNPWHLVVVGPAEAEYRGRIDAAVARSPCRENIHVVGPAYGEKRAAAYMAADAFILPSVSEGLPMAVLEAFAYGLPALLTPQCNLPEAFAEGAALRIEPRKEAICEGLQRLFGLSQDEYAAMRGAARRLAAERSA